jgi:hypothetical protein
MSARGFLGGGDLYINRYDPSLGAFRGFEGPFEASKFEIKPNVEIKNLPSRGRSTYGQNIETVTLPQPSDFTVELPEVNKATLAIALLGDAVALNQGAGTMAAQPFTAIRKEVWLDLGHRNIVAAGFSITNEPGTTTYVMGVDYVVNYRMGWVKILEASAIAPGAVLEASGSYNAVTGTTIRGATQTQVRAQFRLEGINFADQLPVIVDVWEAVIAADSAFDFLASDFNTVSLPGSLKTPVGKTEPFTVELQDNAL